MEAIDLKPHTTHPQWNYTIGARIQSRRRYGEK